MSMIDDKSVHEIVDAWDRGDTVWSVEMGGLGPGYELAIQVLIIELLRDNVDKEFPADDDKKGWTDWGSANRNWGDDTVHRINETVGGFSGAQVGVAKNVALNILRRGYGKAINDPRIKDRLIQVSKRWPHAPEPAGGGDMSLATHCIPWDEDCSICNPNRQENRQLRRLFGVVEGVKRWWRALSLDVKGRLETCRAVKVSVVGWTQNPSLIERASSTLAPGTPYPASTYDAASKPRRVTEQRPTDKKTDKSPRIWGVFRDRERPLLTPDQIAMVLRIRRVERDRELTLINIALKSGAPRQFFG